MELIDALSVYLFMFKVQPNSTLTYLTQGWGCSF